MGGGKEGGSRRLGAVDLGGPHGDEIGPACDQGLQVQPFAVRRDPKGKFAAALLSVAGQATGIDGVGLGPYAVRADEGLDTHGVGPVGRNAGAKEGLQEQALVAAGGFADRQRLRTEVGKKVSQVFGGIGDREELSGVRVVDRHAVLGDIAAENAGEDGCGGDQRCATF